MNKQLKKLMILLLAGIFTISTALAEVKYGSQGEDVRQLQMKLYNMGFMEEKPDGVFGAKTQAGISRLQHYWGVEETGVADDGLLNDLDKLWMLIMTGEEEDALISEEGYPEFCGWVQDEDGLHLQFCHRHIDTYPLKDELAYDNPPDRLHRLLATRICALWIGAIEEMYDELSESIAMQKKTDTFEDRRREFRETLAIKRKAWQEEYGKGAIEAALAEAAWLEETGIDLCYEAYGPKPKHEHEPKHDPEATVLPEATAQPKINP